MRRPFTLRLLLTRDDELRQFLDKAVSAQGTITALVNEIDEEGITFEYPTVSFRTRDGEGIEFKNPTGYHPLFRYSIGKQVTVLYDPDRPRDARIKSFFM